MCICVSICMCLLLMCVYKCPFNIYKTKELGKLIIPCFSWLQRSSLIRSVFMTKYHMARSEFGETNIHSYQSQLFIPHMHDRIMTKFAVSNVRIFLFRCLEKVGKLICMEGSQPVCKGKKMKKRKLIHVCYFKVAFV